MRMKQPSPISVRPRKGSDLERLWESENRSNREMGEHIHSWAETFASMKKQSEEKTDD